MIGKSDESIFVREDEIQVSVKAISHAPRKKFSTAFKNEIARHGALYIMLLLPVAVLIAFRYVPMYGVQIAFRNFRITRAIKADFSQRHHEPDGTPASERHEHT